MSDGLPPSSSQESSVTLPLHSCNFRIPLYFVILAMNAEYGSIGTMPLAGGSGL